MSLTPVWAWLPHQSEPVLAGELEIGHGTRFLYSKDYLASDAAVALDPVELRLRRSARGIPIQAPDGLPGVVRDAMPAGYGADRLRAVHGQGLEPLQLLELGVPDSVGAIEVCHDIEAKLKWHPKDLDDLKVLAEELDAAGPSSRALRRLADDLDTSAGGERPKATLVHEGQLWLAKLQDRGDRAAMPAREYVTMKLAEEVGINAAPVRLFTFGSHQVLTVRRFDRSGDPMRPQRALFASASTLLRLPPTATRGDPQRSYLLLQERLSTWARVSPSGLARLPEQIPELWRRVAFNAIVGNVDDHAGNTACIYTERDGEWAWELSPAYDITPAATHIQAPLEQGPSLALSTGTDNLARTSIERLMSLAERFGLDVGDARLWLRDAATTVANRWESMLRDSAKPVIGDDAGIESLIVSARPAFAYGEWLAQALR